MVHTISYLDLFVQSRLATSWLMSKNSASSFRLLALFPPYIRTAASGLSDSAVSIRRKEITHRGMQALFANMETVLNNPLDFLCADGKYRRLVPMLHFLNMDGALMKTGMAENGA